ncbi:MAG TPA: glutamate 5-kinase [Rhizobiales bacterium]|nr:glutamate 5-kinase [Hyphomicrobiales bacterium]
MTLRITQAKRIVVKIGSALLVDMATGTLKTAWLDALGEDIANLKRLGADVIVVSSGAIALGRRILGLPPGPLKLQESQAAAASGQIILAHAWQKALSAQGLTTGQVLLTLTDTEQRRRYLNARATLFTLMDKGAVPLINENDTVATSEIRYGDNDRLAARVSSMVSADCLALLSDVDGLYTRPPGTRGAEFVPEVEKITPQIEAMAGSATTDVGSGGMITKIDAAKIAIGAGAHMVIAAGHHLHPLKRIADGEKCTWFRPSASPVHARKRWIAGTLEPVGVIVIDDGAVRALNNGKSLLPAGVTEVAGDFNRGDAVSVVDGNGHEIARGLVAYDRPEAERIAGRHSNDIKSLIGYAGRNELIHRDDLVLMEK